MGCELRKLRIYPRLLKQILYLGIPSGIQNSIIALANLVVQSNINAFGSMAMAGCGAYTEIEGFGFLPITSFSLALTTFIGQNLGAKERRSGQTRRTHGHSDLYGAGRADRRVYLSVLAAADLRALTTRRRWWRWA